jgi:hypothetical protein
MDVTWLRPAPCPLASRLSLRRNGLQAFRRGLEPSAHLRAKASDDLVPVEAPPSWAQLLPHGVDIEPRFRRGCDLDVDLVELPNVVTPSDDGSGSEGDRGHDGD